MRKIITLAMAGIFLLSTSCASIVSKSKWPVSISSHPSEAKITITDKKGVVIFNGYTPITLKLHSGSGFFGKARYQIKFEKDGYESRTVPVQFKLNGWYFGNLLLGGVIGMLIIDPATGAMYRIDNDVINVTLQKDNSLSSLNKGDLKILNINEIPENWKKHLVKIDY